MNMTEIIEERPKLHMNKSGELITWEISHELKNFLYDHVTEESKTLETGAGISTLIFLIKWAKHICIAPDPGLIERIEEYCRMKQISLDNTDFLADCSETILPTMALEDIDLVLIDGRHGFPAPFIDWYYTAGPLKIGGLLIVDDVQLWTGKVLKDFLLADPAWQLYETFGHRTVVFKKLANGSERKEWGAQPYVRDMSIKKPSIAVALKSRLYSAFTLIRQRKFLTLAKKLKQSFSLNLSFNKTPLQ